MNNKDEMKRLLETMDRPQWADQRLVEIIADHIFQEQGETSDTFTSENVFRAIADLGISEEDKVQFMNKQVDGYVDQNAYAQIEDILHKLDAELVDSLSQPGIYKKGFKEDDAQGNDNPFRPGDTVRIKQAAMKDFIEHEDGGDDYWAEELQRDNEFYVMDEVDPDGGFIWIEKDGDEMAVPIVWVEATESTHQTYGPDERRF